MKENNIITFDNESKEFILKEVLDKEISKEGFIIDKDTKEEVLAQDGTPITIEEFGGFERGSEIFFKDDIDSMLDYSKKKNSKY